MNSPQARRRECDACGATFTSRSTRARYCTDACRSRARYRRVKVTAVTTPAGPVLDGDVAGLADAVARELHAIGRENSSAGLTALAIARRVDEGTESSAGLAALARELRAVMAEATAHADDDAPSIVDALRARRDERRRGLG